jgi:putative ABC transport system permease protein
MSKDLPKFPFSLLELFCPSEILEGVEGDLQEQFESDQKVHGYKKARRKLFWNVMRFFRPGIILRNKINLSVTSTSMIKSYFTISFRYLLKNRTFSAINILGLALGMASALLIYEYVTFETSYDRFHHEPENIYRVTTGWNKDVTPNDIRATTMPWAGPSVKEAFPEVVEFARLTKLDVFTGFNAIRYKDVLVNDQQIFLADPAFFKVFNFQMLKGDPATALNDPMSIVLTESAARKFFDEEDPIGKIMFLDSHNNLPESNFKVTAVVSDPPVNSHINFDFLISFNVIHKDLHNGSTYWHWDYTYCYLKLTPGSHAGQLAEKMTKLRVSQFGKEMQYYKDVVDFQLQPVTEIHLHSAMKGEMSGNNDGRAISFLMIIGCCIVVCAYINYINLATVKAVERKTEIGIRKVMGSSKVQLSLQLIVESFVLNVFSFAIASLIYFGSVPLLEMSFNIQWPAPDTIFISGRFLTILFPVLIVGIVVSVIYPAFILTSFLPVQVLKGSGIVRARGLSLQKILLTVQFIFCIGFTVATYSLYSQLMHMKTFDLGMNVEQVLVVKGYGFQKFKAYEDFKSNLVSSKNIKSIGISSVAPGDEVINLGLRPSVTVAGKAVLPVELKLVTIDEQFFETIDVEFISGRNFDKGTGDRHSVIINEAAARLFGFVNPSEILHEKLSGLEEGDVEIIGVIQDYNQRSLKSNYEPMVFFPMWNLDYGWNDRYYFVRFESGNNAEYQAIVDEVAVAWRKVNPEKPFHYFFLDHYFDQQYKADTTNTSLFIFFSCFAIFIACLGLFGLVAYTTLQRTKEIGVRKVLGASVQNILVLLSSDFIRLLVVATIVAIPLIVVALKYWLEQYAFRIEVTFWVLAVPVSLVFLLALSTVILKSMRVANANPVESLRYE